MHLHLIIKCKTYCISVIIFYFSILNNFLFCHIKNTLYLNFIYIHTFYINTYLYKYVGVFMAPSYIIIIYITFYKMYDYHLKL